MIPEWLPLAVALLLALVWNVLLLILSALLLLGGPIMIVVAWSAMARRLDCERPAPPGWQESWNKRWPSVPQFYFRTYGTDKNMALALAGVVATVLTFYVSSPILTILGILSDLTIGTNF